MSWGLEEVRVSRGGRQVLAGVTVPADPGLVTVLVGGDGAGKTTCLRVLAGLTGPVSGAVRRPAKKHVGYVPATGGIYPDLTVAENLSFAARAYGLPASERRRKGSEILARTGLAGARDRLGGQLSGGMQRKLAVGLALLHSPGLLLLDEPTTGVDPVSRAELWRLITRAAAIPAAVVVATTYLNEAARAGWVVLLESGTMLASGSPDDILHGVPGRVGAAGGAGRPSDLAWRRGAQWHVWAPDGALPDGAQTVQPDFEDAVVVAALAGRTGR